MPRGKSQFVIVLDETPAKECSVEFRLVYSGRLLGASRTDTRASLKHEIRREFHPQLRRLWKTNLPLIGLVRKTGVVAQQKHESDYYNPMGFGMGNRDYGCDESLFRD